MRVVLAEDSLLLREGLVRLLDEAGASVVAAVGDGEGLVAAVQEHKPDVAVVDVRMPPTFTDEGLRAALEVRRTVPGTEIQSTFKKLGLPPSGDDPRRVMAVLTWLGV